MNAIISDVVDGKYSDIHLSALFITACAARPLDDNEVLALTRAMVEAATGCPGTARWFWISIRSADCRAIEPRPIVVSIIASLGLDDAEDLVASDHLACRHCRHDGNDGAG